LLEKLRNGRHKPPAIAPHAVPARQPLEQIRAGLIHGDALEPRLHPHRFDDRRQVGRVHVGGRPAPQPAPRMRDGDLVYDLCKISTQLPLKIRSVQLDLRALCRITVCA
jgi:hypothetical protein